MPRFLPAPGLFLVLLAAVTAGAGYILAIPPWQSPDEPTHFDYSCRLFSGRAFPGADSQAEILLSMDRHRWWELVGTERPEPLPRFFQDTPFLSLAPSQFGKNPPSLYLLSALVLRIFSGSSPETRLYAFRVLSLGLWLLAGALAMSAAREYFPGRLIPAAAGAVYLLLPQALLIGTSASPDALLNLAGVLWFREVSRACFRGSPRGARIIAVALAGAACGYRFLPALAAGFFALLIFPGRWKTAWRLFMAFGVVLVLLVWFSPGLMGGMISRLGLFARGLSAVLAGRAELPRGYWGWFGNELFQSFWLRFGWMRYSLPEAYYAWLRILCLGAGMGLAAGLFSRRLSPRLTVPLLFAVFSLGAVYLGWGMSPADTSPQGRYLFIALSPLSIVFLSGFLEFFPDRARPGAALTMAAVSAVLALVSLLGYIVPVFSA